ncbi:MAG: helix-turn-helix transcriptional regulator [Proteobacteria bacterium]|nr:helix-turn-helix transcriptional regulator [Pseudomonadota bacterium]
MEQMRVSRRFVLMSGVLAPVLPLGFSDQPDRVPREDILKRLAQNVWTSRVFRGISVEVVAARCGYTNEVQREIEKGKHEITLGQLERLANGLNTSAYHLLRRT